MVFALLAFAQQTQNPKTFRELEIAKMAVYHKLRKLHVESEAHIGNTSKRSYLFVDGDRSHALLEALDGSRVEKIDDGKTSWFIFHAQKKYWQVSDASWPPFKPEDQLLTCGSQSFMFNFSAATPIQFACDPPLQIESIEAVQEGGEALRKVVADVTSAKGNHLTVTQWMLPNQWITKRAEVEVRSKDGVDRISVELKTLDFNPTVDQRQFVMDPSTLSGYQKMEGKPPEHF